MEEPKAPSNYPVSFNKITSKFEYEDEDGICFEFDDEKKAWFPVLDDELLSQQQKAYASQNDTETNMIERIKQEKEKLKHKPRLKPVRKNTAVYVENLPLDINKTEIAEIFSKCGILMEDANNGGYRIKMYEDDGQFNGCALVVFFKPESVKLALVLMDETLVRGQVIRVKEAEFSSESGKDKNEGKKDQNEEQEKYRFQVDKKTLKRKYEQLEKKLDWNDTPTHRNKHRKIVILKYMFSLKELNETPELVYEISQDIQTECEKIGPVKKVVIYDETDDGLCSVKFENEDDALRCCTLFDGRSFDGRKIEAVIYDGKIKLVKKKDSPEEEAKRIQRYSEWLESQD